MPVHRVAKYPFGCQEYSICVGDKYFIFSTFFFRSRGGVLIVVLGEVAVKVTVKGKAVVVVEVVIAVGLVAIVLIVAAVAVSIEVVLVLVAEVL